MPIDLTEKILYIEVVLAEEGATQSRRDGGSLVLRAVVGQRAT